MNLKIVYENKNILAIEKPAGMVVFSEGNPNDPNSLMGCILKTHPELEKIGSSLRYGMAQKLNKETSGILLIAKNKQSLDFLQKQFKERKVNKKYTGLVKGRLQKTKGEIKTLIGRSPKNRKKQKAYLLLEPGSEGKREAVTEYKVLQNFKEYTLIEARPLTGRKHQIRCHFAFLGHPIAGDKVYGFKNQDKLKLKRHFLHASYLEIDTPEGGRKEFFSELPEDLKEILNNLE